MKLRKLGLLSFVICFAFSAQTAPPVLAHCGNCGSGETEPHAAPKKASHGHGSESCAGRTFMDFWSTSSVLY